jgi:hypothetical protein
MTRLTIICISFIIVSFMFAGQGYAAIDPETVLGIWLLDEGQGNTTEDASGNGNDGTLVSAPNWVAGKFGSALDFAGSSSYVDCGNAEALNVEVFSVSFWYNFPSTQTWNHIISRGQHVAAGSPGSVNWGVMMYSAEQRILFETYNNTSWTAVITDTTTNEWHHVVATFDGNTMQLYHDGQLAGTSGGGILLDPSRPFLIGARSDAGSAGGFFSGSIDEVGYFNAVLAPEDIETIMNIGLAEIIGGRTVAVHPQPADGDTCTQTWVTCQWSPGNFATSHDVYFGENFADVDIGTGGTFRANKPLDEAYFVVGLGIAGDPYPDGLVPGTTYYWRIDEVNDLDPSSPWKGKVWSFSIPAKKAHEPAPADGARFIDPDVTLSWTGGFGAVLHHVYFGENFADVQAGTPDTDKVDGPATTFVPGTLEPEKTYYWRVDELDEDDATHTGDVWSFTVAKEGGGLMGEYYHWSGDFPPSQPFQVFVLSRMDPQINWNWGDPGSPDPLVNENNFACRWTGEVEAGFTETYTFYMTTDDGQRLWVDGQLIIDYWVEQGMTEHSGTIDLVAGQRYSITAEHYENGGGAGAELRWSSEHTPKQIIPQVALSPPVRAGSPSPPNGATGVSQVAVLSWNPGTHAASHEVYFGTDPDALARVATKALGDETYDPGKLAWDTTYYWRVDEVNNLHPDSPWRGNVWSFATGDFLVVDNFEQYEGDEVPVTEQIWGRWRDGLGFGAPTAPPYSPGNGTGSEVGDGTTGSYTEETVTHDGSNQSMPYWFNNNKADKFKYSEAARILPAGLRDWTTEGVKALSLWFQGRPASTGSFTVAPNTYTMTASGTDIWYASDEFHYAYKQLSGVGTIVAKVESVEYANEWSKAGVMIRDTLDAGSKFAAVYITPTNTDGTPTYGCRFQARLDTDIDATSDTSVVTAEQTAITAPYWVKLERDVAGNFTGYYSSNGTTWQPMSWNPQNIQMDANVYIGLALTSHDAALTCEAVFSGVQMTGNVVGQWAHQDIGIESNDAEQMYVAIANNTGTPAVVYWEDPDDPEAIATQIDTWTEWNIDLKDFQDKGINLTDVNSIAIGFGDRDNPQPGGAGKMYFDDVRLYRPRYIPGKGTPLAADLSGNGVVDMADLEVMAGDWLMQDAVVTTSNPTTANLVAYYPLNEGAGTVAADSAGARNGTVMGGAQWISGPSGFGSALLFDGNGGQYVDLGTWDPSAGTGQVSVSLWTNWNGISGRWMGLIGKRDTWAADEMMWQIEAAQGDGNISASRHSGLTVGGFGIPEVGKWEHLALTFDGTTGTLYRNAYQVGSGPFNLGPDTEAALVFGACESNGGNPFNGALDEVRIYNRALSQAEIAYLITGGAATLTVPIPSPADLYDGEPEGPRAVNFKDFAILADQWLERQLWPEW